MLTRPGTAGELAVVDEAEGDLPARSRRHSALRVCWSTPLNGLGTLLVVVVLVDALCGQALAPYAPTAPDYGATFSPPSWQHLFGTDEIGRDIFSRVLSGGRLALEIAVVVVGIGAGVGTAIGLVAGYMGGWVDELLMRLTDVFLALPPLVLAIAIAAMLGPSLSHTMLALTVLWWPWYARLIRGQVLSLREREYVEAARAVGAPPLRVMLRHLLPNTLAPLLVQVSLDLGFAILAASSLSFIGLGIQQPAPDWGLMIADAQANIRSVWWAGAFPGFAIIVAVLGFNLFGDVLNDMLDPHRAA